MTPSPSPSLTEFQEAVEQWPEPPTWMYIVFAVIVVVLLVVIIATVAAAIASWNTRKKGEAPPRRADWIDLVGGAAPADGDKRDPDVPRGAEEDHRS